MAETAKEQEHWLTVQRKRARRDIFNVDCSTSEKQCRIERHDY